MATNAREAFGHALRLEPSLRDRMEIVSKCGIALTANPAHALNHYNTGKGHIVASAEASLQSSAPIIWICC